MIVKVINSINKKGYIYNNIFFTMNLKERGITIGDLLIILIIILSTTIVVKSFNKDKKITLNLSNQLKLSSNKTFLPKIY